MVEFVPHSHPCSHERTHTLKIGQWHFRTDDCSFCEWWKLCHSCHRGRGVYTGRHCSKQKKNKRVLARTTGIGWTREKRQRISSEKKDKVKWMVNKICACFLFGGLNELLLDCHTHSQTIPKYRAPVLHCHVSHKYTNISTTAWPCRTFIDEIPTIAPDPQQHQKHMNGPYRIEYGEKNSHWLSDWLNYDKRTKCMAEWEWWWSYCVRVYFMCHSNTFSNKHSDKMRRETEEWMRKKGETNEQFDTFCDTVASRKS